jgi:multiple sugar transport system substrate-binding protein
MMFRNIFYSMGVGLLLSISMTACKQRVKPQTNTPIVQPSLTQNVVPTLVSTRTVVSTEPKNLVTPTDNPEATATPDDRIQIRWFIGVGTGRNTEAVNAAREFARKFNQSQSRIVLELEEVTTSTHDAIDRLMSEIEAGSPPDIVAPADKGWAGEQLAGYIFPMDPAQIEGGLPDANSKVLDSWREAGDLVGIPVGVFPSVIFYNKKLFDAAGLPYPPHKFSEPYADGDPWTIEKMEAIAMRLTLDSSARNASESDFDSSRITQWGFHYQWDSTRSMAVMFGPGSVVDDQGNAVIPQNWREAFHWYYTGMWQKYFIPNLTQTNNLSQGNPFLSGKIAMVHTFLWYSPRLVGVSGWDLAAVPAYQGRITTRMERDGVIILNTTQHLEEAKEVAYAIANSRELLLAWEMLPTIKGLQAQFLEDMLDRHPGVDWQVMLDSVNYADTTYEDSMPNYRKSYDRLLEFKDLMGSDADLTLDEEMDRLAAELQALFEEAP